MRFFHGTCNAALETLGEKLLPAHDVSVAAGKSNSGFQLFLRSETRCRTNFRTLCRWVAHIAFAFRTGDLTKCALDRTNEEVLHTLSIIAKTKPSTPFKDRTDPRPLIAKATRMYSGTSFGEIFSCE